MSVQKAAEALMLFPRQEMRGARPFAAWQRFTEINQDPSIF